MIALPPGCSVCYNITVDVKELTPEMVSWFSDIEGTVTKDEWYDHRGHKKTRTFVAYNGYKRCHHGDGYVRLHFLGKDASAASMFLLKFMDSVFQHNLKEHEELHLG